MAITDKEILALVAKEKVYRIADKDGLYIEVPASGKKRWRFRYRFEGKQQSLSLGVYPDVSLKEARRKAYELKCMLMDGANPAAERSGKKRTAGRAFQDVAMEFFESNNYRVTEAYKRDTILRLENHVFPSIGNKYISAVTVHNMIDVFKSMEKKGILETTRRMRQKCSEIFRYAIVLRLCEHNPAADLQGLIPQPASKHYATITDEDGIGRLLVVIDNYNGYAPVELALQIAPYVFVRPDNLAGAEWSEINFDKAEWRIPADRMKMRQLHIVPLAQQVVELFRQAKDASGSSPYCFPSLRSVKRRITPEALRVALRTLGVTKDELTTHGFRAMASTLLNEQGYNRDWIERQLAHGEGNRVRAAYNHAEFLPERRKMMQHWADYLDRLRAVSSGHNMPDPQR